MKHTWIGITAVLTTVFAMGCASSAKRTPTAAEDQIQKKITALTEESDRNAASIRDTRAEVATLSERLAALEAQINASSTDTGASIQELKENYAFLNDQIVRLDNSMRAAPRTLPVPRPPQATGAFRPGGFDVDAAYKGALDEYYARRFESAMGGFKEVLTIAPASPLADNAQYWIGECYYSLNNYEKALEAFAKVFDFEKSNKGADALLKIGMSYTRMGNTTSAAEQFTAVVDTFPGTSAATIAAQELKKIGQ